jgi:adenosylhomocysteine nucleosidase
VKKQASNQILTPVSVEEAMDAAGPVHTLVFLALEEELLAVQQELGSASGLQLIRTGVGKVQAARAAALAIEQYRPHAVLSVGVAGSLIPALKLGDIVVGTGAVQHDVDVTALGFPAGSWPDGPSLRWADPLLVERLCDATRLVAPPSSVHRGLVASGDQFIHDVAKRARLAEQFGAVCVEMEAAAVAYVAARAGVPFGILRAISDHADGSAVADFPAFLAAASRKLGRVLRHLVA